MSENDYQAHVQAQPTRRRRGRLLWLGIVVGVLVLLAGALGATVLVAGDGQDHALAGKDGFLVRAVPPVKEPLDPKDTIRSS